jgi:ubiquinone/menaquinone biosynthesis C-methylase UbiE
MPDAYERWLAPTVFRPFAVDLARRVAVRARPRVLELAAGTGVLTRELVAADPSPEVTATDLNEAMVAFGRRRVPGATWRQADAMKLPFEDACY